MFGKVSSWSYEEQEKRRDLNRNKNLLYRNSRGQKEALQDLNYD
jgi:hypothetical protein